MSRLWLISDGRWEVLGAFYRLEGRVRGGLRRDRRQLVVGGSSTGGAGVVWRGPPECCGPWQTVWERRRAWAQDGAPGAVLRALMAQGR